MKWVHQEDAQGCGIACLAMVTGVSYGQVREEFAPGWEDNGFTTFELDTFLAEHGYATSRKYKCITHQRRDRETWPPEAWGDVHIACVGTHFVVWLRDGTVLDPATPDARRLSDYSTVGSVAVVQRIREAAQC